MTLENSHHRYTTVVLVKRDVTTETPAYNLCWTVKDGTGEAGALTLVWAGDDAEMFPSVVWAAAQHSGKQPARESWHIGIILWKASVPDEDTFRRESTTNPRTPFSPPTHRGGEKRISSSSPLRSLRSTPFFSCCVLRTCGRGRWLIRRPVSQPYRRTRKCGSWPLPIIDPDSAKRPIFKHFKSIKQNCKQ